MSGTAPLIPNDLATERTILGAILIKPRAIIELAQLTAEDMYDPRHGQILTHMRLLDEQQAPIDPMSLGSVMEASGAMRALLPLGGREYFVDLMAQVITVENLAWHARRLRKIASRRKWLTVASKIAARARDPEVDDDDFLADAETAALGLTNAVDKGNGPQRFSGVLKEYGRLLEHRSEMLSKGTPITGLRTNLERLDHITGGFQPGELIIVAGRPSMGKTALALNALAEAARAGEPGLMFSLEMSKMQLAERLVARESQVDAANLKGGRLNQHDWLQVTRATSKMSSHPIWMEDATGLTIHDVRSASRQWKAANKIPDDQGIIVIDYLQLLESQDRREQNRERVIAEITRGMKLMAKELRLPVVALSQLNRGLEQRADKRPMMSDLRESGAIEQDADTVCFVYREEVYSKRDEDKGIAEIIVGKARNGTTGTAVVSWDEQHQRFRDRLG